MRKFADAGTPLIMDGDVRDYLLAHPDFLTANSDLLAVLTPPENRRGDEIRDFQHFMLSRLQGEVETLKQSRDESQKLIEEHLRRQSRMNGAVLSLLDSPGFIEMIETIESDFPLMLDHEAVGIVVEEGAAPRPRLRTVREGFVRECLPRRDLMLESDIRGTPELFDGKAAFVRSQALVRLTVSPEMPPGLIAFGDRDPKYYANGIPGEALLHMGALVSLCMRKWLGLPA